MIFAGPAGTGKTTTALIIAKTYLKDEEFDTNLLELKFPIFDGYIIYY